MAQTIKNLPAMQETWVQSLGQEDLLGKEMAIHSSILACRIPWTEEADRLCDHEVTKSWIRLSGQHLLHYLLCGLLTVPSTDWLDGICEKQCKTYLFFMNIQNEG